MFKISDSIFDRYWKLGYAELTQPERMFLCIWGLEGEVNNGGFDQYYFNTAGDHALDAVKSLQAIGANHTAELVKAVNGLFGSGGPPSVREERQEQLRALRDPVAEKMAEADQEFSKDRDNLEELLTAFVSQNLAAFRPKPPMNNPPAPPECGQ
ncbi:MAG TPA: DMP19 family protein [Pirellulales bacterium]|nr:DMP19 family protein [Pirellulales bacterium]